MNLNMRKTDSLAHATGSFLDSLYDVQDDWSELAEDIISLGTSLRDQLNRTLAESADDSPTENSIKSDIVSIRDALQEIETTNKEKYDLFIEIDGLDFPLSTPQKLMDLCKEEERKLQFMEDIVKNTSKTALSNEPSLLENSLNSLTDILEEYKKIYDEIDEKMVILEEELEKEHEKARKKYMNIV